jgi:hypothetical protein
MDNSNLLKQIVTMASTCETLLKNLQSGEGFGLNDEQKEELKKKMKEEKLDEKINESLTSMESGMKNFNEAVKKMNNGASN